MQTDHNFIWRTFFWILALLCPSGWSLHAGNCYRMYSTDSHVTWWQAEQACQGVAAGGHLASIKNSESANFVQYKLTTDWPLGDQKDNHGVYIGKNVFSGLYFTSNYANAMSCYRPYALTSSRRHVGGGGGGQSHCFVRACDLRPPSEGAMRLWCHNYA